jgi:hypothetical protein
MSLWKAEWLVDESAGSRSIPALDFLREIPDSASDQLLAILTAVRMSGPDRWFDRQSHAAMRADLAHLHEVRDRQGQTLYRLFVRWLRDEQTVVVIDGRAKPNKTALSKKDYAEVADLAERINEDPRPFASFDDAVALVLDGDGE